MLDLYPPEGFNASERFDLKNYFEKFATATSTNRPSEENDETNYLLQIKEMMGVEMSLADLESLSEVCSIDNLTSSQENSEKFPIEVPATFNSLTKLPDTFIRSSGQNKTATFKCKEKLETERDPLELDLGKRRKFNKIIEYPIPETAPDLSPGADFIVSIKLYRPMKFNFNNARNLSEKLRFNHEIVALGRNTLAQLRDTIICTSDFGLCKEVESTTDDLSEMSDAKSKYPSGFIFIDNVFYNDFRDPNSIDYSAPILEWAKFKKIEDLECQNIDDVCINNLTPRFGYPYLYMHQGDCEHLFVFADARLLTSTDCLHTSSYPHVTKLNRVTSHFCLLCNVSVAKWICIGSDRLPQNKVFLCTECCNSYNYLDGKKIGSFKLYPYYDSKK